MLQTSWVIIVCIDLAVYYLIKERVINISLQKNIKKHTVSSRSLLMDTSVNEQQEVVPALVTSFTWLYKRDIINLCRFILVRVDCNKNLDVRVQFNIIIAKIEHDWAANTQPLFNLFYRRVKGYKKPHLPGFWSLNRASLLSLPPSWGHKSCRNVQTTWLSFCWLPSEDCVLEPTVHLSQDTIALLCI